MKDFSILTFKSCCKNTFVQCLGPFLLILTNYVYYYAQLFNIRGGSTTLFSVKWLNEVKFF